MAQAILDAQERLQLDEVQRLADEELRLHLKARQALDIPLDDQQASLKFLKIYTDYRNKQQRLEFMKQLFRHRCEEDIRKWKLAERRIDASSEREKIRAKTEQQRAEQKTCMRRAKEKAARLRADLQLDARRRQHQAAQQRADTSPLANLKWSTHKPSDAVLSKEAARKVVKPIIEDQVQAAA